MHKELPLIWRQRWRGRIIKVKGKGKVVPVLK
jgi:hypothetical protein